VSLRLWLKRRAGDRHGRASRPAFDSARSVADHAPLHHGCPWFLARERAILVGGPAGIADEPARYEAATAWPRWKGAAAYLAELRQAIS
jgi:hypothetical protein